MDHVSKYIGLDTHKDSIAVGIVEAEAGQASLLLGESMRLP
jgi:hypothetical protein